MQLAHLACSVMQTTCLCLLSRAGVGADAVAARAQL